MVPKYVLHVYRCFSNLNRPLRSFLIYFKFFKRLHAVLISRSLSFRHFLAQLIMCFHRIYLLTNMIQHCSIADFISQVNSLCFCILPSIRNYTYIRIRYECIANRCQLNLCVTLHPVYLSLAFVYLCNAVWKMSWETWAHKALARIWYDYVLKATLYRKVLSCKNRPIIIPRLFVEFLSLEISWRLALNLTVLIHPLTSTKKSIAVNTATISRNGEEGYIMRTKMAFSLKFILFFTLAEL